MNHNHLKRRRGHTPEDESFIAPAHQSWSSPLSQPAADFHNLPPDLRFHLEQIAFYYKIPATQLHQLICGNRYFETTNKKQRQLQDYSMSSQLQGGPVPADNQEKSQQGGQHGLVAVDTGQSSSIIQGTGLSYVTAGLTSMVLCCECFAPCAVPEGYQPISGHNAFDYGTNRPYEGEKPPSAQIPQQDVYVPATLPSNEANSFSIENPGLMSTYMPTFQSLQEGPSQELVTARSGSDSMIYSTDVTAPPYYSDGSEPSASDGHHSLSSTDDHCVAASDVMSGSYNGNLMGMAVSSALPNHASLPATTSGYAMASSYGIPEMGAIETGVKDEEMEMPVTASTSRLDIVYRNQRPPASKRGPFKDQKQRKETAETRKMGSCVRCRMQRIRCKMDPDAPNGECLSCKPKPNSNNHKQLVRQPCLRAKLTDVKLYKKGQAPGFEWTRRWGESGPLDNIANWASNEVKTIRVWEGYTRGMSVQLRVRKFVPQRGDKLERSWVTQDGVKKCVPIPPYAIMDLDEAQAAYQDYIKRGVVDCFNTVIEGVMGARDHLLWATYRKAWEMSQDLSTALDERELLMQTLELWVAVRLTTKSIEIVGSETLGMNHDILDKSSPQHGSIPLPPVMGAQLDMVLIQHIQTKLRREMLEKLQKMTQQNKQKTWLTTYLVTFMLLHNIALLTNHDASYARKHGIETKFARESDVHEYHNGGTILLTYFHYCNKGIFPFTEECRDQDLRQLAQLDEQALNFVRWTRSQVMAHKREWEELHQTKEYEKPFFFVSQLFQRDWQPQTWAY